jgi:tRNA-specific 2-thiouridylase
LGERHGFFIFDGFRDKGPYYVVKKDFKKNILIVSKNNPLKENTKKEFLSDEFVLRDVNWVSFKPEENKKYTAQVRYHGEILASKIKFISKNNVKVFFEKPISVAEGQSCVFYDESICLGGGIIV